MPEKIWFLRRLNLFDGMAPEEVEEISHELKMRACAPRRSLIFDGGDRVFLLKQGRVRLYHVTPDGQEVTTAVVTPGQLFGLGAFTGTDGTATHAEVLEESYLCEAGAQDFLTMLARHPLLMARVVMVMARQIFRLEQTIESMASQPVPRRLASLLMEAMAEGEVTEAGVLLPSHSTGRAGQAGRHHARVGLPEPERLAGWASDNHARSTNRRSGPRTPPSGGRRPEPIQRPLRSLTNLGNSALNSRHADGLPERSTVGLHR